MKSSNYLHERILECMKMNPSENSIVVLSDSDSESEDPKIFTIDESDVTIDSTDDTKIEVITLDDSNVIQPKEMFTIDKTPDFIPISSVAYNKPKRGRKRQFDEASDVIVLKKVKRVKGLTGRMINFAQKNIKTLNRSGHKNQKVKVIRRKKVTNSVKKLNYDGIKQKVPQIQLCHTNIHNTTDTPHVAGGLRPIIIDGCNVAFGFGNGTFQNEGIIFVVDYFKKRGHKEIVCFLPQCYRNKFRPEDIDKQIKEFEKENIITYTPSRYLNGQLIKPYDDRFIVQYASEREGVIISNDGYLDLIDEEPSWRITIEKRIVNFTFARGLLMLPKDPLGPNGPTLDEMLKFPLT